MLTLLKTIESTLDKLSLCFTNTLIWLPCAICLLAAAVIVYVNRRRTKRIMNSIGQMLADAMNGSFLENTFDESRMSKLETAFAHYLSASAVSARNVAIEKDKIKTLIADISHQTKTPIANLMLYSELIEEANLPDDIKSNVQALHHQTKKLRFLIDSLVKLSRLENGIVALNPQMLPLQPLLVSVCEQLMPKAEEKGLFLDLCSMHLSGISAKYDRKWTNEALCNIVDNAIKYTTQGGITISAAAYELFVRIDVKDTGVGIPEAEHAKIFSRFYRAQAAGDSEGVGIGLYLAREIISGEDGYIKVSSILGKGSVFSVFLPR